MKNIIYNDISKTNYYFDYKEMRFYFSSLFYLNKFKNIFVDFLEEETLKLENKFKVSINADLIILILLYKKIEKRGFYIKYKNEILKKDLICKVVL